MDLAFPTYMIPILHLTILMQARLSANSHTVLNCSAQNTCTVPTFLVSHWEKPAYHASSLGFLYGKSKTVRAKNERLTVSKDRSIPTE